MKYGPLSLEHRMAIGATRIGITRAEYRAHVEAGEKWCYACQRWHSTHEMVTRRSTPSGLGNICRRAELARVNAHNAKLRQEPAS